ncbi:MAG: 4Fe-4S dicluster domain-containing protein [Desulfobacteraceae bacterium]|nr:4Fe-4S dicluster domain-containing protein [Desulfobacteraceae bacterium]
MTYFILDSCIGCGLCKTICPSQAITGKKKELYKIKADICIECGSCGRVCPLSAVEDNFGLIAQRVEKKAWVKPFFNLDTCMSCGICLDTCPAGALDSNTQKIGSRHVFPYLPDEFVCMGCQFCASDCPVDAIIMVPRIADQSPTTLKQES